MPKYYCDYCDIFLTHDSSSVRKAHNAGRNHLINVKNYYTDLKPEVTQSVVDAVAKAYAEAGQSMPAQYSGYPQQYSAPGFNPYGRPPSFPQLPPGMPPMRPGEAPPGGVHGLPPRPPMFMGARPPLPGMQHSAGPPPPPGQFPPPMGFPPGAPFPPPGMPPFMPPPPPGQFAPGQFPPPGANGGAPFRPPPPHFSIPPPSSAPSSGAPAPGSLVMHGDRKRRLEETN
ncbi:hypothetical protein BGZ83_010494 [Gryganskiella cystojenkinii]|nr:hypothetical protein BGZ83_010494 [Gryganskiella cystojenkinii]